ncbi:MAG: Lrp/AsnC family transcriptional regulator [Candidatus Nezhaarchaeota archaeon]|nr:Lrp/AsnC family transcriptional regulator [Candidatus Nezhaarchaeota archaeon]MCX8142329.1 Lrp/AsnC family transcriptional regulator [Candidatus Nezhaarchaeota archaeon]MDW8050698.1 Lrp/AsnC family transcriptional regulator [Nitrososphaerota archaeon]
MRPLDEKDLAIVSLYSQRVEISQEEIARELKISQPAVAMRVKRLKSLGVLQFRAGVDPLKMGLHLAKVDVSAISASRVLSKFKDCPYFIGGFITTGRNNLCLLFMAEDISTLESIVDNHLRVEEGVQEVEFNVIVSVINGFIAPFKLFTKVGERQPCGSAIVCKDCKAFNEGLCRGCPALVSKR